MLLRIIKRRTSLEETNIAEVVKTEFYADGSPDLAVSVYYIEEREQALLREWIRSGIIQIHEERGG